MAVFVLPSPTRPSRRSVRLLSVLGVTLGLLLSATTVATADPGGPGDGPTPEPKGSPGTHAAHDGYAYAYPEAPDCDEASVSPEDCVGDDRGFFQGQCTSWVAHRLSQRNGIAFSNWYAGQHWGDADQWAKTARRIGIKPDETPGVGAVAWFRRGHVAYVEQVNSDGSIVISEMNFDGANGFRFVTVTPGYGWPDKFLHFGDVVAYDATPPSAPGPLRLASHAGRVGLAWRPAVDTSGISGYRVLRDGRPIGRTGRTTYWDRRVSAGQAYRYSVLAVDLAGNTSAPVHARRAPGAEAADRAWVDTDAGRALCGRTGSARRQRLACTVLTDSGWRRVPLTRVTDWGHAGSRHFVATADGGAAYCRTVGRASRPRAACTTLDAATLTWGVDVISGRRVPLRPESRTWTATDAGPALCGLSGRPSRPRVGCALLTAAGWRWSAPDRAAAWGAPTSRAFVAGDETLSFCRAVGAGASGASLSCTPFYVRTLRWGYDRASSSPDRGGARTGPTEGTWVATVRGPALCASTPSGTGCRVLTSAGWRFVKARTGGAAADEQAFVAESGTVSWCRTLSTRAGASYRTACTRLDPDRLRWGRDRVGRRSRSLEPASRTWVGTDAGPALCGLSGRAHRSQVGCHVLRRDGWGAVEGLASARGETDYRAFVPSAGGVAFCRTVGRASVACTALGADLTWGRTERSGRVGRTYADSW